MRRAPCFCRRLLSSFERAQHNLMFLTKNLCGIVHKFGFAPLGMKHHRPTDVCNQ